MDLNAIALHPLVTLTDEGTSVTTTGTVNVQADVSGLVQVTPSPITFNPNSGLYSQTLTLTNTSKADLNGPLWLVLKGLDPRVKLVNAFDRTAAGESVVRLMVKRLAPGKPLTVTLQFAGPPGLSLGDTVETFAGG